MNPIVQIKQEHPDWSTRKIARAAQCSHEHVRNVLVEHNIQMLPRGFPRRQPQKRYKEEAGTFSAIEEVQRLFYHQKEARILLQVSNVTLWRWVQDGIVESRKLGREAFFLKSTINKIAAERN